MLETFIGNFDFVHRIGVEYLRSEHTNLTSSNTKWGTDLGTLVVPFEQTIYTHTWLKQIQWGSKKSEHLKNKQTCSWSKCFVIQMPSTMVPASEEQNGIQKVVVPVH